MAVKKNIAAATAVDPKKNAKPEAPVDSEQTNEIPAVKKIDKHNHELEHARNAPAFQKKPDAKNNSSANGKKKNDLSMLETSVKASAAAKAAKQGKKPVKSDKKHHDGEDEA